MTPDDRDTLVMDGWPLGLNNRLRETEQGPLTDDAIPASQLLREAINVDLTRLGHAIRRSGYQKIAAGYSHSLWSDPQLDWGLFVQDGWLTRLWSTGEVQPLQEVQPYAPMSYAVANKAVYWSNGRATGKVTATAAGHWAIPGRPGIAAAPGGPELPDGDYRISAVFADDYGEEYAASDELVVSGSQGITVAVEGSWPAEASTVRVFVSQPNGEVLYEAVELYAPGTYALQRSHLGRGRELETQDMRAPPPGHIVRYFNGRIYVARHDTVLFTEPLRYGLYRPAQGLYVFPSKVTMLEPSLDGLYVGFDGGVVFLQGADPYAVTQVPVLPHSPVPRASTTVPGERLGAGSALVPVWWGRDGAMVAGLPGGQVQQLTRDRLATPEYQSGAMALLEREGISKVVSSMRRGGGVNSMAAGDTIVAEVRRNTVRLNQ